MGSEGIMTTRPARLQVLGRNALAGLMVLAAGLLAACSPIVDHRGYLPREGDMQNLQQGMSKVEVEALLGSPSTTATVNLTGDSYYYISSVVEERAFLRPTEVERQVVAIRFNQNDQVESFAHYGLEDGRIINFSSRETPTRGRELTILQQLFSNIGNVSPLPSQ
jgi:outer membrane protein assembly factor BamE (lipoprotein component of BamABCDE complex)